MNLKRAAPVLLGSVLIAALAALLPQTAGQVAPCSLTTFSFMVVSDNYGGQDAGLKRVLSSALTINPDIRFVATAGDTPDYSRVRPIVDQQLGGKLNCGATRFPFYPTTGNHELDNPANLQWWATNWATNWTSSPATSALALQLPALTNFQRGPLSVLGDGGTSKAIPNGTIYSFDYGDSHFTFVNDYEQVNAVLGDRSAGVYDVNGPAVSDPTNSQLDWLQADLAAAQTKRARFIFGHPALVPIVYSTGNPPPNWSEHNGPFHTADLTRVAADGNIAAYFHGHDHVISRRLVDRASVPLYTRDWFTLLNDPLRPYGDPTQWSMQGPGKAWQEDTGTVFNNYGSFGIARVTPTDVTFELYHYVVDAPVQLYDSFSFPTP